eukprot:gene5161-6423_t
MADITFSIISDRFTLKNLTNNIVGELNRVSGLKVGYLDEQTLQFIQQILNNYSNWIKEFRKVVAYYKRYPSSNTRNQISNFYLNTLHQIESSINYLKRSELQLQLLYINTLVVNNYLLFLHEGITHSSLYGIDRRFQLTLEKKIKEQVELLQNENNLIFYANKGKISTKTDHLQNNGVEVFNRLTIFNNLFYLNGFDLSTFWMSLDPKLCPHGIVVERTRSLLAPISGITQNLDGIPLDFESVKTLYINELNVFQYRRKLWQINLWSGSTLNSIQTIHRDRNGGIELYQKQGGIGGGIRSITNSDEGIDKMIIYPKLSKFLTQSGQIFVGGIQKMKIGNFTYGHDETTSPTTYHLFGHKIGTIFGWGQNKWNSHPIFKNLNSLGATYISKDMIDENKLVLGRSTMVCSQKYIETSGNTVQFQSMEYFGVSGVEIMIFRPNGYIDYQLDVHLPTGSYPKFKLILSGIATGVSPGNNINLNFYQFGIHNSSVLIGNYQEEWTNKGHDPSEWSIADTKTFLEDFKSNYEEGTNITIGPSLICKERDQILSDITKNAIARYSKKDIGNKMDHAFVVLVGAPGVGKTRLLQSIGEALSKVDLPKQNISIEITFKNGTSYNLNSYDKDQSEEVIVALRILYRYFVEGIGQSYEIFFRNFSNKFDINTITPLISFQCIHLYEVSIGKLDPNKEVMINFGIDEFQATLKDTPVEKDNKAALSSIINSLSNLLIRPGKLFFFNITLAGTVLEEIGTIIRKDSGHVYLDFHPTFLSHNAIIEIGTKMLNVENLPKNIARSLIFTGGWPRPLDILIKEIMQLDQPMENYKVSEILTRSKIKFKMNYPVTIGNEFHPLIISYAISGKSVKISDVIQEPNGKTISFRDLQRNGLLSLKESGLVQLPLYFIYVYIDNVSDPSIMYQYLKKSLNIAEEINYDDRMFELFCSYYFLARIHAFSNVYLNSNITSITFQEFFGNDALFIPDGIRNHTIDLSNFKNSIHIEVSSRVPEKNSFLREWANGKQLIINAKGGLVDTIIQFSGNFFFGSMKYSAQNETLREHEFELEKSVKAAIHLKIETKNFYTITYSNKRITEAMQNKFIENSKVFTCKVEEEKTNEKENNQGTKRQKVWVYWRCYPIHIKAVESYRYTDAARASMSLKAMDDQVKTAALEYINRTGMVGTYGEIGWPAVKQFILSRNLSQVADPVGDTRNYLKLEDFNMEGDPARYVAKYDTLYTNF